MPLINKIPTWLAVTVLVACVLLAGTMDYNDQIQQTAGERQ